MFAPKKGSDGGITWQSIPKHYRNFQIKSQYRRNKTDQIINRWVNEMSISGKVSTRGGAMNPGLMKRPKQIIGTHFCYLQALG